MPQMLRPPRMQRNRRKPKPTALGLQPTITFLTPVVTLTFDVPVVMKGIPQGLTNTGKLPISAVQASPMEVQLTYDTPGVVTSVTFPQNDPGIRSTTGGYLAGTTFSV